MPSPSLVSRHVDPQSGHEVVQWEQLRYEDAHTPPGQMPTCPRWPFTFDGEQYDEVLRAAALRLDDLAARELEPRRHGNSSAASVPGSAGWLLPARVPFWHL